MACDAYLRRPEARTRSIVASNYSVSACQLSGYLYYAVFSRWFYSWLNVWTNVVVTNRRIRLEDPKLYPQSFIVFASRFSSVAMTATICWVAASSSLHAAAAAAVEAVWPWTRNDAENCQCIVVLLALRPLFLSQTYVVRFSMMLNSFDTSPAQTAEEREGDHVDAAILYRLYLPVIMRHPKNGPP